jgi:hypothetical protein
MSPDSPPKVRLTRRRSAERPSWSTDEVRAMAFAQKVMKLAIGIVDAAIAEVAFEGPRDPKYIGLALLCRSISNLKGALAMARDNQAIESRTLVRLCFENLFLIGELCVRGSEVVNEMRSHNAASRILVGESGLKNPGVADSEEGKIIREQINALRVEFWKPRKLSVSDTAKGVLARAYPSYALLSHDPAHPSIDALRRHIRSMREHNRQTLTMHVVPPFKPKERLDTFNKGCFALLGVCVGVNDLLGGTSQSDALRALFEEFDRQGGHASA